MEGRNYFGNHVASPDILTGTPNYNVEVSEGNNPPGDFYPAAYLPVVQSENRIGGDYFVLMPGKVIAMDTKKRIIPAGLAWDKEVFSATYAATSGDAAAKLTAAQAAAKIKYTDADVAAGVVAPTGAFAVKDDLIAEDMVTAGLDVTDPVGIIRYSKLRAPGPDPSDPSTFYRHAYDTGGACAFTRWAYIQVPIVETNEREEEIKVGVSSHRIALYPSAAPTFYKADVLVGTITAKANPNLLEPVASGDPTQYAIVGRTIFFNAVIPANTDFTVRYQPKVDLPFTVLKAIYASGTIGAGASGLAEKGLADYLGEVVSYNLDSNFQVLGTTGANTKKVGRILDVREGSSKDLALVRTYFRDLGLWREAPGSATDGRNAYLSIANAPKYIARIAINFNLFY